MSLLSKPVVRSGTTGNRPSDVPDGTCYFDTQLGRPIWSLRASSTGWVDAAGDEV